MESTLTIPPKELCLLDYRQFSSRPYYAPRTIAGFLANVSGIPTASDKISRLDDYVNRLQGEMHKIDAFRRELPLCMLLLNDAIVTLKEELSKFKKLNSEPVLEEFIPLKRTEEEDDVRVGASKPKDVNSREKMNWMSSVQLGNSNGYPNKIDVKLDNDKKRIEEEMNGQTMENLFQSGKARIVGRAFVSFKGCSNFPVIPVRKEDMDELQVVPGLSLSMPDIKNSREEINCPGFGSKLSVSSRSGWSSSASNGHQNLKASGQQQSSARKQRRCWSPELHRRFVRALEQLGGAQVATPKQIRELMQVDGLTNDEVKSHLQKYRIHTQKSTNANVKLGNLWMSHEKCPESSKHSDPESGSPEGPLQLAWEDSMEDHEYEKPGSHHNLKGNNNIQLSVRDG